jgi:excinuclease ABC subunit C
MKFNLNDKKNLKVLKDSPYALLYPQQVRKAPNKPGVYMLIDEYDNIIFIGKSDNGKLKKEIKSKIDITTNGEANKYRWFITGNDEDATELEEKWIEKYTPRFNVDS